MSEIEKMYENAGINGEWRDYRVKNGKIYDGKNPKNRNIRLCKPRFTAEKQLEIVKFLLDKSIYYNAYGNRKHWFYLSDEIENSKYREFDETIAGLINNLWQDLTEVEKQQVKGILE